MMKLHNLKPNPKARHRRKRVARGESSGHGKTAGRGGKGQTARSGSGGRADFEGGQTPIMRRVPKFGFHSISAGDRHAVAVVNLEDLNQFPAKTEVNLQTMKDGKLIAKTAMSVRVLAKGKLAHPLTIKANHFSKAALAKISEVHGTAEVL